jgi:hypothetical protein
MCKRPIGGDGVDVVGVRDFETRSGGGVRIGCVVGEDGGVVTTEENVGGAAVGSEVGTVVVNIEYAVFRR